MRKPLFSHTTHMDNHGGIWFISMYVKPISCPCITKKFLLFQRRVERDTFMQWVASINGHYHAGKPKHVSQLDKSFLTIMERNTFSAMSPSDVQIQLQQGVIVIPDMNLPGHPFSRQGIRELNSLNTDVRIEGM